MASSHAEIKAGAFVAFCLALLFVMVFAVGDCGKFLRGSTELEVLFSSVTGLQPNSAVNYAGVEIGRVRATAIVEVDEAILARIPRITPDNLSRLPLSYDEIEKLTALSDHNQIDREARLVIGRRQDGTRSTAGRKMILLVLEIMRGPDFRFRDDDVVRLSTTVMGDSTVEISPGNGQDLVAGKALLGDGSNLFTQLSESMREIRTLLSRVSNLVGEDEKNRIKAIFENMEKASADVSTATADVRRMIAKYEPSISAAVLDIEKGMADARKAVGEVRATVEDMRPKVVAALDSGKAMIDSGRNAAISAEKLLEESRPRAAALLDDTAAAARAASAALKEMQEFLVKTDDALDENRPALRRAMVDVRESARNFREMTARLKREPWILLKSPRVRDQEAVLVEAAARQLSEATSELAVTAEYLQSLVDDPEAAARLQDERMHDLIKQIRTLHDELQGRRTKVEDKVQELDRKGGGRALEKAREEADQVR
jgi:ABC-type transporter Mla subunit MlaD